VGAHRSQRSTETRLLRVPARIDPVAKSVPVRIASRRLPRLTAVIPATKDPPTLACCVRAIESAAEPPEEVLVIDRCATGGPAGARNEGARRAAGEVLVFIDADVAVHSDAFSRVRAAFRSEPELDGLFGSYDDTPAAPGLVSQFRNLLHHHVHQTSPGRATTFWAGLGAMRRDVFLASGGFDEVRFTAPFVEDIELGMRIVEAGARVRLDPGLLGTHLKRWTLGGMVWTDLTRRGAPWVAMLLRRRSLSSALNLSWRNRLTAAAWLSALAGLAGRRAGAALGALAAVLMLNQSLYALLVQRLGLLRGSVGVALHGLHNPTAVASVPVGAAGYARERRSGRRLAATRAQVRAGGEGDSETMPADELAALIPDHQPGLVDAVR
jgi:cellulose synthase/poly-beta-1,6-N-acetylglucosamine synthase-like glycosyltransferase